jgi:hypothetical protein
VCPDCLVDLVDDPDATVRCRHCGREWPATMVSCPVCLAELRPDPAVAAEALGAILSHGGRLYRPDGVPFAAGPACTLLRLSARGSLVFTGPTELVEATVAGRQGRAEPPMACHDHDGSVLFRLLAYEPAQQGLVAVGADGAALATYLRAGPDVEVRDETSAPVATLTRRLGQYALVETGGGVLAAVASADTELEGWIDDQWSLAPAPRGRRLPLRLLAAVGLVLAAKALLGRPAPVRARGGDDQPDELQPWRFG